MLIPKVNVRGTAKWSRDEPEDISYEDAQVRARGAGRGCMVERSHYPSRVGGKGLGVGCEVPQSWELGGGGVSLGQVGSKFGVGLE